ncbi:hypothetical protein L3Q82_022264, partial [Scortum barcoo]
KAVRRACFLILLLPSRTNSGTTSTQAEAPDLSSSGGESDEPRNLQEPQEDEQADGGASDGDPEPSQVEEDLCNSDAETLPQETPTDTQDDADCLPLSPLPTEEELTPPSVSSHPSSTQDRPSEPCWYCLRSLDSEYRPETQKQVATAMTKHATSLRQC